MVGRFQLGSWDPDLFKEEKEALKDYLAGMSVAAYGVASNTCITNQSQFPGAGSTWDGCEQKDKFLINKDQYKYDFSNVVLNGNGGDDDIFINSDYKDIKKWDIDGGGNDEVALKGGKLNDTSVKAEAIDVVVTNSSQMINKSIFSGGDVNIATGKFDDSKVDANNIVMTANIGSQLINNSSVLGGDIDINADNITASKLCGERVEVRSQNVNATTISGSKINVNANGKGIITGSSIYGGESIDDLINLKAGNRFVNSTVAAGSGDDNIIIKLSGDNKFDGTFVDAGAGHDDINVSSPFVSGGTLYGGSGDDTIAYDASNVGLLNNISIRWLRLAR